MSPQADSKDEAIRILECAETKGVVLRLLGGIAFYLRCPSARNEMLSRDYGDIDLMGHERQSAEIRVLLGELGYFPQERFNAIHGGRRLVFTDSNLHRRIDVFLDVFEMSHKLNLRDRLEIDRQTLTLADLLATKLQIVQTNEKDVVDMISLLVDHDVGATDAHDTINGKYLARLCSEDWGLYKTFTMKLALLSAAVEGWGIDEAERELVRKRIGHLETAIEAAAKSIAWKIRAAIGERVRWYEIPEEDVGAMGQVRARRP